MRDDLDKTLEHVSAAREWLKLYQTRTSLNRSVKSDLLTVRCSTTMRKPITHGAFLVALHLEDMQVKRCSAEERNAWTNISFKLPKPSR